MIKIKNLILFAILSLAALSSFSYAEVIDRIVAEVNGDVITLSELNEHGKPFFQSIMKTSPANSVESEIQKARIDILDRLIDDLLIRQESERLGISILESDVDSAIASIIAENKVTPENFKNELKRMGTDEKSYRENIKSQMLKSRMINYEIRSKLVITEEKIQEYYNTLYKNKADADDGYHILQIGFIWGEQNRSKSRDEALQKAESVKKRLDQGEEFSSLAMEFSDLPSAEDGGNIGTFKKEEMSKDMLEIVKDMRPGDTSAVIETSTGFQILKLLSETTDGTVTKAPLDSVRNEIKETIYKQEMDSGYEKWMNGIREKAYIKKNLDSAPQ